MSEIKSLPENYEAEKFILGCMIMDADFQKRIRELTEIDFTYDSSRQIFNYIKNSYETGKKLDLIDLFGKFPAYGEILDSYSKIIPTSGAFNNHLQELKRISYIRQIARNAARIYEYCTSIYDEEPERVHSECAAILGGKPENSKKKPTNLIELSRMTLEKLEQRSNDPLSQRLNYGIRQLDAFTGGLTKGELTLLAARPSLGKTSLALQIVLNLCANGIKVVVVSLEMTAESLTERLLCNLSGTNSSRLKNTRYLDNYDWKRLLEADKQIASKNYNLEILDDIQNIRDLNTRCQELKTEGKLEFLVLDYLQLVSLVKSTNNRVSDISEISRSLKLLSMKHDIPVLALSQLNREGARYDPKTGPELYHLRDSGSLEQDADNVIFLYEPPEEDADTSKTTEKLMIKIGKQRNGSTGTFSIQFCKSIYKFVDL